MRKVLKINAGIACLDRANEVEPRPNEDRLRDVAIATLYRHCEERSDVAIPNNQRVFGHGLATPSSTLLRLLQSCLLRNDGVVWLPSCFRGCVKTYKGIQTASFAMTVRGYVFNPANLANPINHGSDKSADNISFAAIAMTVLFRRLRASAHFQFSPVRAAELIFNFQLDKAVEAENPQPKSRH